MLGFCTRVHQQKIPGSTGRCRPVLTSVYDLEAAAFVADYTGFIRQLWQFCCCCGRGGSGDAVRARRDRHGGIPLICHALHLNPVAQCEIRIIAFYTTADVIAVMPGAIALCIATAIARHKNRRLASDLIGDRHITQGADFAGGCIPVQGRNAGTGFVICFKRGTGQKQRTTQDQAGVQMFHAMILPVIADQGNAIDPCHDTRHTL